MTSSVIPKAIHAGRLIAFTYNGLPRVVQPATYGLSAAGKRYLRAVQIRGRSRSNTLPCWELYAEEKMVEVVILEEGFEDFDVAGYTRGDSVFATIIAEH
jgi:hypothetical protein